MCEVIDLARFEEIFRNSIGEFGRVTKSIESELKEICLAVMYGLDVMLIGESGVGKEVSVEFLKLFLKKERGGFVPLVPVNCADLPDGLISSLLFGSTRGSYTGAFRNTAGKVEDAKGGILFLDEAHRLKDMGVLLRFMEKKEYHPIGGKKKNGDDIIVVMGTNVKVESLNDSFPNELLFRFGSRVHIPPLRERAGDISTLTLFHLNYLQSERGVDFSGNSEEDFRDIANEMKKRPFRACNVRELFCVLNSAVMKMGLAGRNRLLISDFSDKNSDDFTNDGLIKINPNSSLEGFLAYAERKRIQEALISADYSLSEASKILRISVNDLAMKAYQLNLSHLFLSDKERISRAKERDEERVVVLPEPATIEVSDNQDESVAVDPADVCFKNLKFSAGLLSGEWDCQLSGSLFSNNEDWKPFSLSIASLSDSSRAPFLDLSAEERRCSFKKALDENEGCITKAGRSLGLNSSTSSWLTKKLDLADYAKELRIKS